MHAHARALTHTGMEAPGQQRLCCDFECLAKLFPLYLSKDHLGEIEAALLIHLSCDQPREQSWGPGIPSEHSPYTVFSTHPVNREHGDRTQTTRRQVVGAEVRLGWVGVGMRGAGFAFISWWDMG